MKQNNSGLEPFKPNQAFSAKGEVYIKNFKTFNEEVLWVGCDILEKHQADLGQVTILARRKKLLYEVMRIFGEKEIEHRLYFRKGEFISAPLAWLNAILNLFNTPNRERSMKMVIGTFNQIANLDIAFSIIKERKQNSNNVSLLSIWLDEVNQALGNKQSNCKEIIQLVETQLGIKTYKSFYNKIFKWFDHAENISGMIYSYDEYTEEKKVWRKLSNEIFDRLGNEIPLSTFLQELSICAKETARKPDEISLMTIHAAKGQGFDHVYLIGMVDDELPSYHALKSNQQEVIEEERRNCYVAITRASKTLTLTYADKIFDWDKKPSRFLRDMELIEN